MTHRTTYRDGSHYTHRDTGSATEARHFELLLELSGVTDFATNERYSIITEQGRLAYRWTLVRDNAKEISFKEHLTT